jgi:hypothetical protein
METTNLTALPIIEGVSHDTLYGIVDQKATDLLGEFTFNLAYPTLVGVVGSEQTQQMQSIKDEDIYALCWNRAVGYITFLYNNVGAQAVKAQSGFRRAG